jgi:phosphoadenosine phosphosulfate reductase
MPSSPVAPLASSALTGPAPKSVDIAALNERLAGATAHEVLEAAFSLFGPRLALASSFSVEDCVLMDLALKIEPKARVFTLDTGRLHQETYDVLDRVRGKYGIEVEVFFPAAASVEQLVRLKGPNSFYTSVEDRRECCGLRKVEPLRRALAGAPAWATGLRRGQAVTRHELSFFELDANNGGLVKVSPLCAWSKDEVWAYANEHYVPVHRLHERGFPSIGCAPCTRAIEPGQDERAGRWWWEDPAHKECGLHGPGGHS